MGQKGSFSVLLKEGPFGGYRIRLTSINHCVGGASRELKAKIPHSYVPVIVSAHMVKVGDLSS